MSLALLPESHLCAGEADEGEGFGVPVADLAGQPPGLPVVVEGQREVAEFVLDRGQCGQCDALVHAVAATSRYGDRGGGQLESLPVFTPILGPIALGVSIASAAFSVYQGDLLGAVTALPGIGIGAKAVKLGRAADKASDSYFAGKAARQAAGGGRQKVTDLSRRQVQRDGRAMGKARSAVGGFTPVEVQSAFVGWRCTRTSST